MRQVSTAQLKIRASTGDYLQHGSASGTDCVIAFAFGYRQVGGHIEPGSSNQQIAGHIIEAYFRLPKIVQHEIADALPPTARAVYRIEQHRQPGEYLDTREVAVQAKDIMDRHGWKKAIIIAHPYHLPLADATCQKLGIATVAPSGLSAIGFDPDSAQDWTRDPAAWTTHEAEAIDRDAAKGWI